MLWDNVKEVTFSDLLDFFENDYYPIDPYRLEYLLENRIHKGKLMKNIIFFSEPFALIYQYRMILFQTVKTDIRARFAGSILGIFWLFLYQLLFLGAYAAVYVYIFQVRYSSFSTGEYVLLIFCGLIPFLGFAETLSLGIPSVVQNSSLIKNTLFPIELIPVKAVIVSQCTQAVGMGMLIIAIICLGKTSIFSPLFLLIWLFQIIFCIGLIWLLSSLNVFIRDISQIITVIVLILMMISPIAYTVDMVPSGLQPFLAINPLYYLIVGYQSVLLSGYPIEWSIIFTFLVISIIIFYLGYYVFKLLMSAFTDNI